MKRKTSRSVTTGAPSPMVRRDLPQRVRLIGGAWKRTPLAVINRPGLRPTPDRVRETLFNWLTHLRPDIAQLRGLDLYAGTGALGFELASRGAARVVLIERDVQLVSALRDNVARLCASAVEVLHGKSLGIAAQLPSASFDVIFLDPPFDEGLPSAALSEARRLLAPEGVIYLEAPAALSEDEAAAFGLWRVREGRAGRVYFHLLRHGSA